MTNEKIVSDWLGIKGLEIDALGSHVITQLFLDKLLEITKKDYDLLDFFTTGNEAIRVIDGKLYARINARKEVLQTAKRGIYQPTIFPQDTTQLWIPDGDSTKDTVLIVGEGGPKNNLDFESNGRIYWEYLKTYNNYYTAVIHQSSSYNKSIFDAEDFDFEDAEVEVDNSSEILYRAIKYFKDRGKYVIVFGHSYSAFVIPHYLSTRPSLADRYVITGGRLDADSLQTSYQKQLINTGFEEDGVTLEVPDADQKPPKYRTQRYFTIRKNKEKLKYALGVYRYTEELKEKDLSNVVFFYGTKDQNVGKLSQKEIDFLNAKGALVRGVNTGHYKIWQRLLDSVWAGKVKF